MELKGKKVLITGADGFIGSHLVEGMLDEGAHVRAFVYYNSFGSWGWLDTLSSEKIKQIEIIAGDVRDPRQVEEAVKGCDVVFHLAALIAIPYSYQAVDAFVDTNIKGTLNVLQAARISGAKVLLTSTSEVYGTAQYVPMDEKHPLQGQSPYSATKIGADHLGEAFFRSFETPVVTVRPFNTYGPRQSARAIIPTIITQLLSGAKSISLGRLDPVRDFNYVKDTAAGFIAIAKADNVLGEEINLASGEGISIADLAEMIMKVSEMKAEIITDQSRMRPTNSEVERLVGSNKKITALTGWIPAFSFEKGIAETVEWFRDKGNLSHYKSDIYNI
jgi:NAD dependent epimerase/dehydratase